MGLQHVVLCYPLVNLLQQLARLVFWWPSISIDGTNAVNYVHGAGKASYHRKILRLAKSFVNSLKQLCSDHPRFIPYLDKPNVHRLLELVVHTIPIYGHALFVSELVFEGGHQPLKFSLSRSTNPNAHIYATQLNIGRDWLVRIAQTFHIIKYGSTDKKREGYRSLFYLFCGPRMESLNWNLPQLAKVKCEIEEYLFKSIDGLVYHFLEKWYDTGVDSFEHDGTWKGADPRDKEEEEEDSDEERWFRSQPVDVFGRLSDRSTHVDTHLYDKASYYRSGHGASPPRYKHHSIALGDSVELLLDQSLSSRPIFVPSSTGLGTRVRVIIRALGSVGPSNEKESQL